MSENINFKYTGHEELKMVETSLTNYNSFIVKNFMKHSSSAKKILDFGAGVGTLAHKWQDLNSKSKIICFEVDPTQIQILNDRKFETYSDLSQVPDCEYIYTSNVLEHIKDDQSALISLYDKLTINGRLGIFVPAHQFLYSKFDAKVEHFRRYSKKDLEKKVRDAGFEIECSFYIDSLGFFAWFLVKLTNSSFANQNSTLIKFYDKYIWPLSRLLDACGCKFLFGKNLLLLAHKKN